MPFKLGHDPSRIVRTPSAGPPFYLARFLSTTTGSHIDLLRINSILRLSIIPLVSSKVTFKNLGATG
jgi:hypothetical protein